MRRRAFIAALGGAAAWPLAVRAQSRTVARVGFLRQAGPDDKHFYAFRNGLYVCLAAPRGPRAGKLVVVPEEADVRWLG